LGLPSRIFEKKSREGEKGDDITRFDGTIMTDYCIIYITRWRIFDIFSRAFSANTPVELLVKQKNCNTSPNNWTTAIIFALIPMQTLPVLIPTNILT
jgi:hypothetical protein